MKFLTLLIGMLTMTSISHSQDRPNGVAVHLNPGQDVAAIVKKSPPGSTFLFAAGTYHSAQIMAKDADIFRGTGIVILSGSRPLTMKKNGKLWSAPIIVAAANKTHCSKRYPRCWIANDLFLDDKLLELVGNIDELAPNKWFYDDVYGLAYIDVNPNGHRMEVSSVPVAISGAASGVEVRDLIIEKYANAAQTGALGGGRALARDWTVEHVEARWNHGTGISLGAGSRVVHCWIHHNGQLGLGISGGKDLVEENEISYNNYAGYNASWEAGGTKFSLTNGLIVENNYVHDNNGNGLWTDIDNIHTIYENNKVTGNAGDGIRHEISYDASIHDNTVTNNTAGIVIVLSSNVEISGNRVVVPLTGTDGIRLANGSRGSGLFGPHTTQNAHIVNNTIIYHGSMAKSGLSGSLDTAQEIVFDSNIYYFLDHDNKHWLWGDSLGGIDIMQSNGLEQHSKIVRKIPSELHP